MVLKKLGVELLEEFKAVVQYLGEVEGMQVREKKQNKTLCSATDLLGCSISVLWGERAGNMKIWPSKSALFPLPICECRDVKMCLLYLFLKS